MRNQVNVSGAGMCVGALRRSHKNTKCFNKPFQLEVDFKVLCILQQMTTPTTTQTMPQTRQETIYKILNIKDSQFAYHTQSLAITRMTLHGIFCERLGIKPAINISFVEYLLSIASKI